MAWPLASPREAIEQPATWPCLASAACLTTCVEPRSGSVAFESARLGPRLEAELRMCAPMFRRRLRLGSLHLVRCVQLPSKIKQVVTRAHYMV